MAVTPNLCQVQVSCFRLTDATSCYLANARHELEKLVGCMQSRELTAIRWILNVNQVTETSALATARATRVDFKNREHARF